MSGHRLETVSCGTATLRDAAGVIELLLVMPRRKMSMWGFPKGHLEPDEDPQAAAVRETLEETGYSVRIVDEPFPSVMTSSRREMKTVRIYPALLIAPAPVAPRDDENIDVRWFSLDALPDVHIYQRPLIASLRSRAGIYVYDATP